MGPESERRSRPQLSAGIGLTALDEDRCQQSAWRGLILRSRGCWADLGLAGPYHSAPPHEIGPVGPPIGVWSPVWWVPQSECGGGRIVRWRGGMEDARPRAPQHLAHAKISRRSFFSRHARENMSQEGGFAPPGATTLMFRNIPRRYTNRLLLREIELVAGASSVDMVFLPWDGDVRNMGCASGAHHAPAEDLDCPQLSGENSKGPA